MPESAIFIAGPPDVVQLDFSEALEPRSFPDVGDWIIRFDGSDYNVDGGVIDGNIVNLTVDEDVSTGPGDTITLLVPPTDLVTLSSGIPVKPFTDFPLVAG